MFQELEELVLRVLQGAFERYLAHEYVRPTILEQFKCAVTKHLLAETEITVSTGAVDSAITIDEHGRCGLDPMPLVGEIIMIRGFTILDSQHKQIRATSLQQVLAFEKGDGNRIASTILQDGPEEVRVSTVFLRHSAYADLGGMFETMVFGGALDEIQERCHTWDEAEKQHVIIVNEIKKMRQEAEQSVINLLLNRQADLFGTAYNMGELLDGLFELDQE